MNADGGVGTVRIEVVAYIRFVVNEIDGDSGRTQGLFQASGTLRDAGLLSEDEVAEPFSETET
jgi:hypothetical protein